MKKITDLEKQILREIGYYFLEDNDNDYDKAYRVIRTLGIKEIKYKFDFVKGNICKISLERPGLFIGNKGKTVEAITERLSKMLNTKITISFEENNLDDFLYPKDWKDEYYNGCED